MTSQPVSVSPLDIGRRRFVEVMPEHFERLRWSRDELDRFRTERLRLLISVAATRSPYHAKRLAGVDPGRFNLSDLPALPVMTKADMMANYDEVVTDRRITRAVVEAHLSGAKAEPELLFDQYFVLTSGGSSGVRGMFAWDREAGVEFFATVLRSGMQQVAGMMGWPPPRPLPITLAAAATGMHATRAFITLARGVATPTFAPATLPVEELARVVEAAQPLLIAGYTSTIARLADERAAGRLQASPRMVVVTSEQLTPDLSARIARGFGMHPANNFASTEGLVGSAPPGSEVFDFASDTSIVEFVDAEDRPVSQGQEADHVLLTNLSNHVQPLIRYRLDDRMTEIEFSPAHGHQRARLEGRNDTHLDFGGVEIHPFVLRSTFLRHPEVIEYQVRYTDTRLTADVVAGGPTDAAALANDLAAALASANAPGIEVRVRVVDSVARDPNTGKARRFVREG
ncbi:MAG: hypothetical protein AB7J35_15270 [Dehalococcoidia bacterium]